jgi:hypothetical protein
LVRCLDPTRPINGNDGWENVITDITTIHDYRDYEELATTYKDLSSLPKLAGNSGKVILVQEIAGVDPAAQHVRGAPIMCTEFGGLNVAPTEGQTVGAKDWGYTTVSDGGDLVARFERQIQGLVQEGELCTVVYTQLSDIEQEVNGLYTYDRRAKADPAKMKAVMERAEAAYFEALKKKGIV